MSRCSGVGVRTERRALGAGCPRALALPRSQLRPALGAGPLPRWVLMTPAGILRVTALCPMVGIFRRSSPERAWASSSLSRPPSLDLGPPTAVAAFVLPGIRRHAPILDGGQPPRLSARHHARPSLGRCLALLQTRLGSTGGLRCVGGGARGPTWPRALSRHCRCLGLRSRAGSARRCGERGQRGKAQGRAPGCAAVQRRRPFPAAERALCSDGYTLDPGVSSCSFCTELDPAQDFRPHHSKQDLVSGATPCHPILL